MKKIEYSKPSLEEADFGKFVAGASIDEGNSGEFGGDTGAGGLS